MIETAIFIVVLTWGIRSNLIRSRGQSAEAIVLIVQNILTVKNFLLFTTIIFSIAVIAWDRIATWQHHNAWHRDWELHENIMQSDPFRTTWLTICYLVRNGSHECWDLALVSYQYPLFIVRGNEIGRSFGWENENQIYPAQSPDRWIWIKIWFYFS